MSNGAQGDPSAPALAELAESLAAVILDPENLAKLGKHAQEIGLERAKDGLELGITLAGDVAGWLATRVIELTSVPGPVGDNLARAAMDTLLNDKGPSQQQGIAVGRRLIGKLAGTGAAMQPGYDGAAGLVGLILSEQIEAWLRGVMVELMSSWSLMGNSIGDGVDAFARLQDVVESMLGGGRLVRQVLGPIIRATAVTPAEWQTNLTYRPELLGAGPAVEAHLAGLYSGAQLLEELARQGYSDERINILVNNARKRLSFADLVDQHYRGALSETDVITRAGALGYDANTAAELLALATARRRDKWKDPIADTAVAAYLAGELEELDMRAAVETAAPNYTDAQGIIAAAKARRELRRHGLSASDERRLVLKGIRAVGDYRRALAREGFDLEAQIALELELRFDLDARHDLEAAKAAAGAEREAEEHRRAAEKAARDAAAAARQALPTLNEYRRAYTRGHIDRPTLAAAITREKLAITPADLELLLLEADEARAAYLAQLEAKRIAEAKRVDPALSAATLEAAVLAEILTLGEYDARLGQLGYDADERRVLVSLLGARLEDREEARRRRAEATTAAEVKSISLPDLERAVRLGLRSVADYAAVLDALATPPVARALLLDLLNAEMAQDAAAREAREQRDATAAAGGLALGQRRRAVLAGVLPRGAYEAALIAAGWPVDDQLVELALVDLEMAQAAADRARRDQIAQETEARREAAAIERAQREAERQAREAERQAEKAQRAIEAAEREAARAAEKAAREAEQAARDAEREAKANLPPELTLGQMERAVKLGILPPDALRAWLDERNYGADDVAIVVALAVAAIPDIREAEEIDRTVTRELAAQGVAHADLKNAVRRGIRTLEEYGAELEARGFSGDAVALLEQLLGEQVAIDLDGLRKSITAMLGKAAEAPPLAELEAALLGEELDAAQLRDVLGLYKVPRDTALVFARLVLATAPPTSA